MRRREFLRAALAGALGAVIPALPPQLGDGPGGRRVGDAMRVRIKEGGRYLVSAASAVGDLCLDLKAGMILEFTEEGWTRVDRGTVYRLE